MWGHILVPGAKMNTGVGTPVWLKKVARLKRFKLPPVADLVQVFLCFLFTQGVCWRFSSHFWTDSTKTSLFSSPLLELYDKFPMESPLNWNILMNKWRSSSYYCYAYVCAAEGEMIGITQKSSRPTKQRQSQSNIRRRNFLSWASIHTPNLENILKSFLGT